MKVLSLLLALATTSTPSHAEFRQFEGVIEAASNYVHYSEGYVVTPGYVDISNLVFEAADGGKRAKIFAKDWTDDGGDGAEVEVWDDDGEDDGGERFLEDAALGSTVSIIKHAALCGIAFRRSGKLTLFVHSLYPPTPLVC